MHEQRHRSFGVVPDDAQISSVRFYWPGLHVMKAMARCKAHRILNSRVIPDLNTCVVPPIEPVPDIAAIVEGDPLLEKGRVRTQDEFYRPLHSVNPIDIPYLYGSTAIILLSEGEIDRRSCDPVVRDRKVELTSKPRPRAAIGNLGFFDRGFFVKDWLSADFVCAAV